MGVPGMVVGSYRGTKGEISIPGLGAVVATFNSWTLTRREDRGPGNPVWDLRAVLSYVNGSLMNNERVQKKIKLTVGKMPSQDKPTIINICSYDKLRLEGTSLLVEGVHQCP